MYKANISFAPIPLCLTICITLNNNFYVDLYVVDPSPL